MIFTTLGNIKVRCLKSKSSAYLKMTLKHLYVEDTANFSVSLIGQRKTKRSRAPTAFIISR